MFGCQRNHNMAMNSVWMHHKKINWKLDVDKIWQSGWWLKRLADVVVGGSPEMQMIWREKKKAFPDLYKGGVVAS